MSGIADLIERLEKAERPDREVDARIAVACGDVIMREDPDLGFSFFDAPGGERNWAFLSGCKDGEDDAYRELGRCLSTKHYTASPDAAIALVERMLPGFGISVETHPVYGDWWDAAIFDQMPKTVSNARKQTAALALCLALCRALLRALQQEDRR